jgi:type IV pilus assembly protein PilA
MLKKLRNTNEKGFTLIELMIVIAIIGILAAIAIPNFISYRNKAFCSTAERDANAVVAALGNHFSIIDNTTVPSSVANIDGNLTTTNTTVTISEDADTGVISIAVIDQSGRCPADYQAASDGWTNGTFTLQMQ